MVGFLNFIQAQVTWTFIYKPFVIDDLDGCSEDEQNESQELCTFLKNDFDLIKSEPEVGPIKYTFESRTYPSSDESNDLTIPNKIIVQFAGSEEEFFTRLLNQVSIQLLERGSHYVPATVLNGFGKKVIDEFSMALKVLKEDNNSYGILITQDINEYSGFSYLYKGNSYTGEPPDGVINCNVKPGC
jgi:hypothetical protein